jgi:hypothetical protein
MSNSQTTEQFNKAQKLSGNVNNNPEDTDEPKPPIPDSIIVDPIKESSTKLGEVIDPPR